MNVTTKDLEEYLGKNGGILTATSARVYRELYFGNDLIAPNSSAKVADDRGYVPVELWIMSTVEAINPKLKKTEGLTMINILGEEVSLKDLKTLAPEILFGKYAGKWPLTKILDIGGKPIKTSFGTIETPPILAHVHRRKTEAYYFPPTNIPPYNRTISAKTRIALKNGVTKDDAKKGLAEFGRSDLMYTLFAEYDIRPMSGWTIPEGVLHAPGPYITFEIQRPMDDNNLASWRLGEKLSEAERKSKYQSEVLHGVKDEDELLEKVVNWDLTSDQKFEDKFFRQAKLLDSGTWGKRYQIFFDMFYGEGWTIEPGQTLTLAPIDFPQAGVVWSGQGLLNENLLGQNGDNEFLCIPNTPISIKNTGEAPLHIYTVEPMRD
jgi:hypothetical protein